MNWQMIGIEVARLVLTAGLAVLVAALLFRKRIAPELVEALEEASKTAKTLASLGGIKKAQWTTTREMEKAIGAELIHSKMPELQALKMVLPGDLWEELEAFIEENPDGAMQLYKKYGHLIPGSDQPKDETYMF